MSKYYVLDTNILLHDPTSFLRFQEHTVVLPIEVITEIDKFKKEQTERGQNARRVTRHLDGFRNGHPLSEGVELPNGGRLQVYFHSLIEAQASAKAAAKTRIGALEATPPATGSNGANGHADWSQRPPIAMPREEMDADTALLRCAWTMHQQHPYDHIVLVTKDINLRLRADAMGIKAEEYKTDQVQLDELYSGQIDMELEADEVDAFVESELIESPDPYALPNEFVHVHGPEEDDGKPSALGRIEVLPRDDEPGGEPVPHIRLIKNDSNDGICGIRPRNKEQYFAFDALLDPRIKLVTIMGSAGTGKTLLALAAGLHLAVHSRRFKGVLVSRPVIPMGKDLGYLPGTIEEKMQPWMKPIADTLDFILSQDRGIRATPAELTGSGRVQIEPLTYIRGRNICQQFMIVDEAQNLTPLEVKTVITRVGDDTKIVLTGDPHQIDHPFLDSSSNGFNYLINRFKGEAIAAHIQLRKGERSALAERAAQLL